MSYVEFDPDGRVIKTKNPENAETNYDYDKNSNIVKVTEFSCDPRNFVDAINYSNGKEVQFAYNKNGELVAMMDWNGTVNFALSACLLKKMSRSLC